MKKALLLLVVAFVSGLAAFYFMRSYKLADRGGVMLDSMPELAWVRTELKLTDEQFAKVSQLHADYRPRCEEMCRQIAEARADLEAIALKSREVGPDLQAAIRQHAETRERCRQAMFRHMYDTAAVLDEDQAARYLETMLPFATDHAAAAGTRHSR